jgi:hypothetical protein
MIEHEFLEEFGILSVRAYEPFDLDQLYALVAGLDDTPSAASGRPVLFDLREVDVSRIAPHEMRRFLMRKSVLDPSVTQVPVAYLVDGVLSHASVRMANTFSELAGIGSDERTCVVEDMKEAVRFLSKVVGLGEEDCALLEERLAPADAAAFPRGSA